MEKVRFDKKERGKVIAAKEAEGLMLAEEWNHVDGNFLLFRKSGEVVPPAPSPIDEIRQRLDAIEADVGSLKSAKPA